MFQCAMYVSDDIEYMVVADYIENQGFIYPAIGNRILITNGTTSSADALLASTFIVLACLSLPYIKLNCFLNEIL